MVLVDAVNRLLKRVSLCNRHAPPEHLLGMVTCIQVRTVAASIASSLITFAYCLIMFSEQEFECIVRDYCAAKSVARRAKRRMQKVPASAIG
jgi:hypothetical protein